MCADVNQPGTGATKASDGVAEKKKVTPEEFITRSPLYVVECVDGFALPAKISFECNGPCKKETTWTKTYGPENVNSRNFSIKSFAYHCGLCDRSRLTVIYKVVKKEKRLEPVRYVGGLSRTPPPPPSETEVEVEVMKVGQYPALSTVLPAGLEKNLGEDAATLYRKGLICRHNGFGLAAVAYIRRVVEDKTNELIEVAASLAETRGIEAAVVSKMRQAAASTDYTPYQDKLKVAATVYPDNLKVGSINPLERLYSLVSEGLHGLTEAGCVEVADQITGVFEFVFSKLRAEIKDHKEFEAEVKRLGSPLKINS